MLRDLRLPGASNADIMYFAVRAGPAHCPVRASSCPHAAEPAAPCPALASSPAGAVHHLKRTESLGLLTLGTPPCSPCVYVYVCVHGHACVLQWGGFYWA